jgi:hypothetical protein
MLRKEHFSLILLQHADLAAPGQQIQIYFPFPSSLVIKTSIITSLSLTFNGMKISQR